MLIDRVSAMSEIAAKANADRLVSLADVRDALNSLEGIDPATLAPRWVSVKERLPEPEREVLVQCETRPHNFKYQCIAIYIPKKWYREDSDFNWDWECCDEYDEEADDYYVNEGWYERIRNWDDYDVVGIGDFVTHWMELPEPPKGGEYNR